MPLDVSEKQASLSRLRGNYWTLSQHFARMLQGVPASRRLSVTVTDPERGLVPLSGCLSEPPGATALVIIVHGLGGSATSGYMRSAANAAWLRGYAALRLNLRGASGDGSDFYHAGLGSDLDAWLDHPDVERYARRAVLAYSLGGHVALSHALLGSPRYGALATLCSPLDLASAQYGFDHVMPRVYRKHVLESLKAMYRVVARSGVAGYPANRLGEIHTIYEWDDRIVAPRFGFPSAAEYYRCVSVKPKMAGLTVPTLCVRGLDDPMVVDNASLPAPGACCEVFDAPGGHVAFGRGFRLGAGRGTPELQVIDWLARHAFGHELSR